MLEDPAGALNYTTLYAYDTLDNLTGVTQGTQTRTFTYDSLSWLASATNPESGAANYTYDLNGNLLTKVIAGRGITINYSPAGFPIDALNRVKKKTYSDGTPAVDYTYDTCPNGKGRVCGVTNGGRRARTSMTIWGG